MQGVSKKKKLNSLKAFYNDPFKDRDPNALFADLERESDRSAVVIMASVLEDGLKLAIAKRMNMRKLADIKELDDIFGFDRPMGSFSDKIKVAYAFHVIEKQTHDQLNIIRELRNACAHSQYPISFATPELREYTMELFKPSNEPFIDPNDIDDENLKDAFLTETMAIGVCLSEGTRQQARDRLWVEASKMTPEN